MRINTWLMAVLLFLAATAGCGYPGFVWESGKKSRTDSRPTAISIRDTISARPPHRYCPACDRRSAENSWDWYRAQLSFVTCQAMPRAETSPSDRSARCMQPGEQVAPNVDSFELNLRGRTCQQRRANPEQKAALTKVGEGHFPCDGQLQR